ncbi:MAG: porphobilinogen synthase [Dissulfurimicrobium sp.]|uniref:porphobilinogen synthase n=1 Tax=Dissulfurimicrobium TaxID=1769732 RepID=UPI001EDC17D6|nr:porphobilinogen synthase [Dissulfurimicrobium hydrothermale]UKL12916.1 porphobilinogen synthase [Dissulfurimicrobium hydrothermale]
MMFPEYRARRMRRSEALRAMVRETELSVKHLVYPLFIIPGSGIKEQINAMPGCFHLSVDKAAEEAKEILDLGIPAVIVFGLPEHKDSRGTEAWSQHGTVQKAVPAIKKAAPDLVVITDVCMCEYTSHGHCGVVSKDGVENDATLESLAKIALSHARSGADMVAPSDMMDGRIGAIREALDENGFEHIPIMSYAVKYASAFYGPFREAADSAPQFGDRRSYQMDPPNQREAVREAMLDLEEGADILMVKPAMPYLDIIHLLRQEFTLPIAAYQVSGEYSMIKAAARSGWIDEARAIDESLTCIRRAGADIIITYFAKDYAKGQA